MLSFVHGIKKNKAEEHRGREGNINRMKSESETNPKRLNHMK